MDDITIEYRYSLEEAVRASVEVTHALSLPHRLFPWMSAFMIVACAVGVATAQVAVADLIFPLIFGVVGLAMPTITRWAAKRRAKKIQSLGAMIRWQISESELINSMEGSETRFAWDQLIKVQERKDGFLLFPHPRIAYWLPKSAFSNLTEITRLREMIEKQPIPFIR